MTKFIIEIVVDPRKATTGTKKVRKELKATETAADKMNKQLKRAFTFAGIFLATKQVATLADEFTNLQNRLKTVTDTEAELVTVTEELFDIANRTRSAYDGTVEVFARVGLAAKDLGRDQQELLQFTESLNQAVTLSGASAIEAKAGLIQLSQGLGSGALRGDELRSVLEQLPVVADVIAESLGVTRGELRELGADGKISAEIVLDAFKEARVELEERFGEAVPTLGQSFTVLRNNMLEYVGAADESLGASEGLSVTILGLSDNIDELIAGVGTLGVTFAALKLAPIGTRALAAASAFVELRIAVASGRAVILGSAAATAAQAAAEVAGAEATLAKAAANVALIETETAKAVVVLGTAEATFIQAAVDTQATAAQAAHVAAANALTAAQGRLAVATAATTVQARILALVNPFAIAVAATAAFGFALNSLLDDLKDVNEEIGKNVAADAKIGLTEYGKVGEDILRVQENLAEVTANIDRDLANKGFANPTALAIAERYREQLARLGLEQAALADGSAKTTVQAREQIQALEDLAGAVAEVVAGFEQENMLLAENSRERGIQAELIRQVAELNKGEGPEVTEAQAAVLEGTIRQNQALREQAEVLERIRGPQQAFETNMRALTALLDQGTISQEEFNAELLNLAQSADDLDLTGLDLEQFAGQLGELDIDKFRELLASIRGADAETGVPLSAELQLQADLLERIKGPARIYAETQAALAVLFQENKISLEEYTAALESAAQAAGDLAIEDTAEGVGTIFEDAGTEFSKFLEDGTQDFDDFVNNYLAGLALIAAEQALLALFGQPGATEGVASVFASAFGGGKAKGGDVDPNKAFLVGEEGPEIFSPDSAGEIVPAGETAALMGGGQAAAPVVNVSPAQVTNLILDDPNAIPAAINEGAADDALVNVVTRKRRTIKGIIG